MYNIHVAPDTKERETVEIWSEFQNSYMNVYSNNNKIILWKLCSRKFMRPLHFYTIAEKSVKEKDRTGPNFRDTLLGKLSETETWLSENERILEF